MNTFTYLQGFCDSYGKNPTSKPISVRDFSTHRQPLLRFPKKSAALRFFLAFFDRCAIKTSLFLPPAALRFSARHATALPRCPSYSYNQNRTTHLCGWFCFGRGRRDRTLGTRFWRPLLYLLSYTPIKIKKSGGDSGTRTRDRPVMSR